MGTLSIRVRIEELCQPIDLVPSHQSRLTSSLLAKSLAVEWRINVQKDDLDVRTVDLILDGASPNKEPRSGFSTTFVDEQSLPLPLSTLVHGARESSKERERIGIKIILAAARGGYVSRSDMIEFRFFGCQSTQSASGFLKPLQYVPAFDLGKATNTGGPLHDVLDNAIGAIVAKPSPNVHIEVILEELELEVKNRLSIKWLLPNPIYPRTLAMVGCRPDRISFEVLPALGITQIILENAGHEAEDDNGPYARFRQKFIPCNISPDAGMAQRVVDALNGVHVDGIYTQYDVYQTGTARAAEILGLNTSSSSAFAIATDKYATRMLDSDKNSAICVNTGRDFLDVVHSDEKPVEFDYPVVVKPCTGRASWSVIKAETEAQVAAAVDKAHSRIIGYEEDGSPIQSPIMVEPYVDGPEVDVNFAMLDGEVLFYDVSDNFPCAGDLTGGIPGQHDFQETMFVFPSILPQSEQELLKDKLCNALLAMGFRTGIFHCEGRVRNSSMHYITTNGTIDLETKTKPPTSKPSAFMLEVNPRPPGYIGRLAVTWTFGVDYYAMHVFRCLGDWTRCRTTATPFANGAQHDCALVLIMPEKGGILTSDDPAIELRRTRPDLIDSIAIYRNVFEKGQRVTPPDAVDMAFLSTVVVNTTKGRKDLIRKAEEIRENWHATIEDE